MASYRSSISSLPSARTHTQCANGGLSDKRRKSVLRRTHGTYIRTCRDETGGAPASGCATCARERNRTRALGERSRTREKERKGERETVKRRKTKEEQEAGVFRDVVCAVYANWARVNARNARDGI